SLYSDDNDIEKAQEEMLKELRKQDNLSLGSKTKIQTDKYLNELEKIMGTGKYTTVEEALSRDKKLLNLKNNVMSSGASKNSGQLTDRQLNLVSELESLEELKYKNNYINKDAQLLRSFGDAMGVKESNYASSSDYNKALYDKANTFYKDNTAMMQSFLNGSNDALANAWSGMGSTEKASTYRTLQQLEKILGVDEKDSVTTKLNTGESTEGEVDNFKGKRKYGTEKDIFTNQEKEMLNYLHYEKDSKGNKTGKIIYDADNISGDGMGINELLEWQTQGEKKVDYSLRDASARFLGVDNAKSKSAQELSTLAKRQYNALEDESTDATLKLGNLIRDLENGKKPLGTVNGEVAELIKAQDREGLESIRQRYQDKAESGDKIATTNMSAIDKVIDLMDKIEGVEAEGLLSIIAGVEKIADLAKDMGNVLTYTKAQMGDSGAYGASVDKSLAESINTVLDGNKEALDFIKKNAKSPEETVEMMTNALINGGILESDGTTDTVELSAETLEAMTVAFAEANAKGLKDAFKTNEGIDKATGDKQVNAELSKIVITGSDGAEKTGSQVAAEIKELNAQIAADGKNASKDAIAARDALLDELVPAYEQAIKATVEAVGEGGDSLEKSAKTFAEKMKLYDESISKAIGVLDRRINGIDSWGVNTNVGTPSRGGVARFGPE
ncbi:MAG: hypothetical protein ACRCX2_11095, partial [Paraclostridium sp.]